MKPQFSARAHGSLSHTAIDPGFNNHQRQIGTDYLARADRLTAAPPAWALPAILGTFVLVATLYSVIVPPFETPDEIWHFAFVQHIATGQGLPVSEADTQALWQQQGVQAPGYYLTAAALTFWVDQSDFPALYSRSNPHRAIGRPDAPNNRNYLIHYREENWPWRGSVLALHLARFLSIVLGAITLWASYKALNLILDARRALVSIAIFAFIPQFLFISAAASNDNAVNALAALVLWQLVVLIVHADAIGKADTLRPRFILLGCLLGLALLSKLSALGLVALAGLTVLWLAWHMRTWSVLVEALLWIAGPAVLISGWWYLRNWVLYADPLAWNIWQANILLRVEAAGWRTIIAELGSLERSFWGLFGWLNIPYPELVYMFLRGLELLISLGLALVSVRWLIYDRRLSRRSWAGILLIAWLCVLIISWLRFMHIAPAAQGRYFFPAAPAIALLIALGIGAWRIWTLGWLVAACLLLLSALTPFWLIRPAYQPPMQRMVAPRLVPVQAMLGEEQYAVLGVHAEPADLVPGESATITVEWQALAPNSIDYSVFLHFVDEDGLIVAQHDTMPGGGLRPTSQWEIGEKHTEQYTIPIPPTAYTPNQGHWLLGLYDSATGQRLPVRLAAGHNSTSAEVTAGENTVQFGSVTVNTPAGSVPNPIGVEFQDNITLLGYDFSHRSLRPGDILDVTLYWAARGPVSESYTVFVHLLGPGQEMYGGDDDTPEPPANQWHLSAPVTDRHRFVVSEDATPGTYQIEVGLYTSPGFHRLTLVQADGAEGADRLLLGPLHIGN